MAGTQSTGADQTQGLNHGGGGRVSWRPSKDSGLSLESQGQPLGLLSKTKSGRAFSNLCGCTAGRRVLTWGRQEGNSCTGVARLQAVKAKGNTRINFRWYLTVRVCSKCCQEWLLAKLFSFSYMKAQVTDHQGVLPCGNGEGECDAWMHGILHSNQTQWTSKMYIKQCRYISKDSID